MSKMDDAPLTAGDIMGERARVRELAQWLYDGRAAGGDPDLAVMPEDVLSRVRYVTSHRGVGKALREAEITAAWELLDLLEREIPRVRLAITEAAADLGMSYRQLAPMMRVSGRAGVEARIARLRAAVAGGPMDARRTRRARSQRREVATLRAQRGIELLALASKIAASVPAELIEECGVGDLEMTVAEHRGAAEPSEGLIARLSLIVGELRADPRLNAEQRALFEQGALSLKQPADR